MAHAFILMWDEAACATLPQRYQETLSCVWDSRRSLDPANPFNDLLAKRW